MPETLAPAMTVPETVMSTMTVPETQAPSDSRGSGFKRDGRSAWPWDLRQDRGKCHRKSGPGACRARYYARRGAVKTCASGLLLPSVECARWPGSKAVTANCAGHRGA